MSSFRSRLFHPTEFLASFVTLSLTVLPRPVNSLKHVTFRRPRSHMLSLHAAVASISTDEEVMRMRAMERRVSPIPRPQTLRKPTAESSKSSEIHSHVLDSDIHAAIRQGELLLEKDDEFWLEDLDLWSVIDESIDVVEPPPSQIELQLRMNAASRRSKISEIDPDCTNLIFTVDDDIVKSVSILGRKKDHELQLRMNAASRRSKMSKNDPVSPNLISTVDDDIVKSVSILEEKKDYKAKGGAASTTNILDSKSASTSQTLQAKATSTKKRLSLESTSSPLSLQVEETKRITPKRLSSESSSLSRSSQIEEPKRITSKERLSSESASLSRSARLEEIKLITLKERSLSESTSLSRPSQIEETKRITQKRRLSAESTSLSRTSKMKSIKRVTPKERLSSKSTSLSQSSHAEETKRITPQEEIRLSRIIQEGAKLHKMKSEHEEKLGHEISHSEWATMAGISSNELQGHISNYLEAKSKLVMANMGLIHSVINNNPGYNRKNGVPKDDLVQEGSLGLIRAAELFDPDLGFRFSTYATTWIKGILSNNKLDMNIVIPQREKNLSQKVEQLQKQFHNDHGRFGTHEEIASLANVKVRDIERVLHKIPKVRNVASLDQKYNVLSSSGADQSEMSLHEKVLIDNQEQEFRQMREDVMNCLDKNLNKMEARLMKLRYGLEDGKSRSINECAKVMGTSFSTARRIGLGCLEKLREAENSESLMEYLIT